MVRALVLAWAQGQLAGPARPFNDPFADEESEMVETGVGLREKALAAWERCQREQIEAEAREVEQRHAQRCAALENHLQHWLGLNVEVTEDPFVVDGIPFGFPDSETYALGVWCSCPDCGEYRGWEDVSRWEHVGRILAECIPVAGADEPQTVRQEPCRECIERRERERIGNQEPGADFVTEAGRPVGTESWTMIDQDPRDYSHPKSHAELYQIDPLEYAGVELERAVAEFVRQVQEAVR